MKAKEILWAMIITWIAAGTGQAQFSTDYQTNIISGVVTNWGSLYNVGYTNSFDVFLLENGAVFTSGGIVLGEQSTAGNNVAVVQGAGTVWNSSSDFYIGDSGPENSVVLSNGAIIVVPGQFAVGFDYSTNNSCLVTGSNSVLTVGRGSFIGFGAGNSLTISNGGAVYMAQTVNIGNYGSNSKVVVTGSGSVWSNSSNLALVGPNCTLEIRKGGFVYCGGESWIGASDTSINSSVLVTDSGSVWSNGSDLYLGQTGSSSSLIISNGGAVFSSDGVMAFDVDNEPSGTNNLIAVVGSGSFWSDQYGLWLGPAHLGNCLKIREGGTVRTAGLSGGSVQIDGGNLIVTNALHTATLLIRISNPTAFVVNSGTVAVDQILGTNNAGGTIIFNTGLIQSGHTSLSNSLVFAVGNGTGAAIFQISGGIHSFANGLEVSSNATLTGCGTINGNVTIDPGGLVLADCGNTLTFANTVTNNGTLRIIDGSLLEVYGTVVNNGVLDLINGTTNFHGVFVNNGTLLTAASVNISQASQSGQDFVVQVPSVIGHTYQLQSSVSLTPANWINTGNPLAGTGSVLSFTDPGGATNSPSRFYQVQVTAP